MLVKVLIGAAGVAAVGTVVAVVTKKEEQHNDVAEQAVKKDEDGSILKRIHRFVKKKVIKFLAWVALHMEQIEAASAVIGLASGVISIAGAIRDYKAGSDLANKIDELEDQMYKYHHANCHNQRVIVTCEEFMMDKLEVNDDEVEQRLVEIDKEDGYSA
jgi:hypothetical protein